MNPEHKSFLVGINPAPGRGELSVLFSGEARPFGGHGIGPAVHDYYLVHTVIAGEGVFETGGKRYTCMAGDSFFIFPGELFSYQADPHNPWHYVWVSFVGHAGDPLLSVIGVTLANPVVRGGGEGSILGLYRKLRNGFRHADNASLADLESAGLLRLLLHEFGKANRTSLPVRHAPLADIDRQIDQAARWLSLQFNQQISIEGMCRSLGYHRTHLSKMFKRTTGLSPMQYLYKIRMERAQTLLESPLTIDQIASSVGFNDALYFSKQFRKWSGQSPSSYRETLRISQP
jgi:AraC-like DNA-binding protein